MEKMNLWILLIALLGIILLILILEILMLRFLLLIPQIKSSEIENFSQTIFSHCINFVDNSVDNSINSFVNYPFWKLYFDGSKSNDGDGAGCILISPDGVKTMLTCRLEFQCTNNTVEYEALIQGLKKAINMNVQDILVFGDSEIVVK
jgi:hypothetical protein